ncbi:MAG: hypothetical protein ABSD72_15825 [Terracidiphilus sp.]|jgi:hypothetical protein
MARKLLQAVSCLILCPLLMGQEAASPVIAPADQLATPPPAKKASSSIVSIRMDTLVVLRLEERVSTANAKQGDKVRLTLVNDLATGGRVIIPAGTSCYLTITRVWRATPKDPFLVARVQFAAPKLDLGHGQMVRLTDLNYAQRHSDDGGISNHEAFLMLIAAPIWLPSMLLQEAKARRAVVTPKNWKPEDKDTTYEAGKRFNYYFPRAVNIHVNQQATQEPTGAFSATKAKSAEAASGPAKPTTPTGAVPE